MRILPIALLLLVGATIDAAQDLASSPPQTMPVGIVRGILLFSESGSVEVQRKDGAVLGCLYDSHTLFQRNQWPIHASDLKSGEPVEVLSDRKPGARTCYTRMLSVVYAAEPLRRGEPAKPRAESFIPHGYLTFAGLVIKTEASKITLKTSAGIRTLLLRSDTHYTGDGVRVDAPALVNKHVFIRGGRDIYGMLEAYQVMWGDILRSQ